MTPHPRCIRRNKELPEGDKSCSRGKLENHSGPGGIRGSRPSSYQKRVPFLVEQHLTLGQELRPLFSSLPTARAVAISIHYAQLHPHRGVSMGQSAGDEWHQI